MNNDLRFWWNALKNSYKTIDIRAVLVKTAETKYNWTCVYLTIRLKEDSVEELTKLHNSIERNLGKIDKKDFKIKFEVKTIDKFMSIIDKINNKNLEICSLPCLFNDLQIDNILNYNILNFNCNIFENCYKTICATFGRPTSGSLYKTLVDLNVDFKKYIHNDEDIFKWFEMTT